MLKTIDVGDLQVGMYLHDLAGSWLKHPFWRTARLLDDPADLQLVMESGIRKAVIDTSRGIDIDTPDRSTANSSIGNETATPTAAVEHTTRFRQHKIAATLPLSMELARAAKICARSKKAVMRMFGEARMGNALDANVAGVVVNEIADSIARNSSAIISLARLKKRDDYTYMHSVSVCALMIALARQLGLNETDVKLAGHAGLMHDIGKMSIPLAVLNKPGKLTDAEFTSVRGHPEAGHSMLKLLGSINEITLDVCLHHHEKMDGTGYPSGLTGDQISLYARMAAICDVYDAITSDRPYRAGWCPADSIKKMASWMGSHFDPLLFQAFVSTVGIFPVGSLVRLKSNRLAIVVDQNEGSLLVPMVRAFYSCTSVAYISPQLIDLQGIGGSDSIISLESPEDWGLTNIERFWT